MKINEEMASCAKINFENLEKAVPGLAQHTYYMIAKGQLDEALGEENALEKRLGPYKEIGSVTFNEDGTQTLTGCIASVEKSKEP